MPEPGERMLWIRNLEAVGQAASSITFDVELGSEIRIAGLLNYGSGNILCGALTLDPDRSGLYKYLLRVRFTQQVADEIPQGTARGYLFPEGPAGELVALLSLHFQTRFYVLSRTIGELSPQSLAVKTELPPIRGDFAPRLDPIVFSRAPRSFDGSLSSFLDEVRLLPPTHHLPFVIAAWHYSRALREIGVDEEMIFVRLVSAVESVAQGIVPNERDVLAGLAFKEVARYEAMDQEQIDELRGTFEVRRTKARFVAFLERYCTGFFENEPREPANTQVTPETLRQVAGAVYNARSGYLHNGEPMYLSRFSHKFPEWHMDPFQGMTWQDRYFAGKKKLPHASFFHRLTRHCILTYFHELTKGSST